MGRTIVLLGPQRIGHPYQPTPRFKTAGTNEILVLHYSKTVESSAVAATGVFLLLEMPKHPCRPRRNPSRRPPQIRPRQDGGLSEWEYEDSENMLKWGGRSKRRVLTAMEVEIRVEVGVK